METNHLTPEDRAAIDRYNATLDLTGSDENSDPLAELFRALIGLKYRRPQWLTDDVLQVLRKAKERRCHQLLYHLAPRLIQLGCEDWVSRLCIGTGPDHEHGPASYFPPTHDQISEVFIESLLVHDAGAIGESSGECDGKS